jgi:hypothetical protein
MGNKSRIIRNGVILLILFLAFPPLASGAESPPCVAFAYVLAEDDQHASLVLEDTFVFGDEVIVYSNCNNTTILVDGMFAASTETGSLYTYISAGEHSITLRNDGFNMTMDNVTFIQSGQLTNIIHELPSEHNPYSESWTPTEIGNLELVSGIGAMLISWFIVVGIMWRIINNYHDRNYCMEVS